MSKSPITPKLLTQWFVSRFAIPCGICFKELEATDVIQWDHIHAEVFDGPHVWGNLRPVHYECHKIKSRADVQAAAKVKRLANPKPSKHPMKSSGRKIPSRPFAKKKG